MIAHSSVTSIRSPKPYLLVKWGLNLTSDDFGIFCQWALVFHVSRIHPEDRRVALYLICFPDDHSAITFHPGMGFELLCQRHSDVKPARMAMPA